jgi:imidazolonepropionase-like amidohydrolase
MKSGKKSKFTWAYLVLSLAPALALAAPVQRLALVGGTLVDGYGGRPIRDSVVIIEGERIKAIGTVGTIEIPRGTEVISTEGMTVLPGLWDAHVHLMINGHTNYAHWDKTYVSKFRDVIMPASAKQLLMAGVTSAREVGAPLDDVLAVREAVNSGKLPGPTLYVCGPFLQHEPYPGEELYRWGIKGEKDAREKVQILVKAGVDFIKLIDQDEMTREEVKAVIDESHLNGKTVVVHAHRPDEIRRALELGADCLEHTGLATAPEYPADVMAMIKERTARMNLGPLFWTPTISPLWNYTYVRDNPEILDDPSCYEGLPEDIVKDIRDSFRHPDRLSYYQITPQRIPTLARKFQQLRESGLVLLIGTDSGVPMLFHSQSTWNELDIWVSKLGVDPLEAIRAATYWPAVQMRVDDQVGTVSEGKYADIIAVRGDVLRYINLLQRVDVVIKRGRRYK